MEIKVSVIVPVYNVENYLEKCLDSIVNQTLGEIEIILLNDGSTDASYEIAARYAEKDPRIVLLSHENRGLGPTRNRGIEVARGEYLAFVDSDDTIVPDGLEKLYRRAKAADADIVQGETVSVEEEGGAGTLRKSLEGVEDIRITEENTAEFFVRYYFSRIYTPSAWDKLIRRSFALKWGLVYGDNRRIFAEDNWFQLQALLHNPRICFCAVSYYRYLQRATSIMHQPKKALVERHGQMIEDYSELISRLGRDGKADAERAVRAMIAADVFTMVALDVRNCGGTKKDFFQRAKTVPTCPSLKESVRDLWRCRAYRMEPSRGRRKYLTVMGLLYRLGWYGIAHRLVWYLYRNR